MQTVSSEHSGTAVHMNPQCLEQRAEDLYRAKLDQIPAWKGELGPEFCC